MTSQKDSCTNFSMHTFSFGTVENHKPQCDLDPESGLPPSIATLCRQDEACMQGFGQTAWAVNSLQAS